jgi:hypothetical protein
MLNSFLTIAQLSDIMIGSEITPLQKMSLVKATKEFRGTEDYVGAVIA